MAARRLAASAVDWAAFVERVHPQQMELFRAFKAKSDGLIAKVHRFPEALPKIDFAFYSSRVSNPAMVAEFEKAYKALNIPYPQDKNKVREQVDAEEKDAMEKIKKYAEESEKSVEDARLMLRKIKELPSVENFTLEMYYEYFPEVYEHEQKYPTFWPHTKAYQPENDPHTIH